MHQGRRRQQGFGVLLLLYQLFGVIGIDHIPPVTLATIAAQIAIYLRVLNVWKDPFQVCVSAYMVLKKKQYARLLYAAFEHGDDWHLYYNMLSFAVKGRTLERRFGSFKFLYILGVFTVLTNIVLVALNKFLSDFDDDYGSDCVIGFSGVIFALKVLTTYYDHNYTQQILGFPITIPSKYAVWVELVLIQMIYPNVSFIGHLAGILVGMAYVFGPLKFIMNFVYSIVKMIVHPSSSVPRFVPRAEATGYAQANFSEYIPSGMTEEEQIQHAMNESMQQSRNRVPPYPTSHSSRSSPPPPAGFMFENNNHSPPPPGFAPHIEELRRQRTARFS